MRIYFNFKKSMSCSAVLGAATGLYKHVAYAFPARCWRAVGRHGLVHWFGGWRWRAATAGDCFVIGEDVLEPYIWDRHNIWVLWVEDLDKFGWCICIAHYGRGLSVCLCERKREREREWEREVLYSLKDGAKSKVDSLPITRGRLKAQYETKSVASYKTVFMFHVGDWFRNSSEVGTILCENFPLYSTDRNKFRSEYSVQWCYARNSPVQIPVVEPEWRSGEEMRSDSIVRL